MTQIETHPLTPYLPSNAKLLMLGSFPPPKTRWKMEFYYPNYNNDMWRILGLIFYQDKDYFIEITNKSFKQPLIEQFLQHYGIAISDTAYQVIRLQDNASDKFLQIVETMDIAQLLQSLPHCQTLITTGEKATEILIEQFAKGQTLSKVGQSIELNIADKTVKLYRLPSSSRAYPLALAKKAEYYREVFQDIGFISIT